MQFGTIFPATLSLGLILSTAAVPHIKRSNTCTIALQLHSEDLPGGDPMSGAGANTAIFDHYGLFTYPNGSQFTFQAYQKNQDDYWIYSNGTYTNGTGWSVGSGDYGLSNCVAQLGSTFYNSEDVDDSTCKTYSGGGPFYADQGCECFFDC
ncbi:hypothetical protein N7474_006946 [Penicillium riverlandense]|uniref:uncharacterized protein n=1 Tax=Penicillium riverlandense TaxID=1903569 RepID=UPI0025472E21|nr:uncharacterized protein N7474_006946 [Penicillium riverlandense]KAJ5815169.1 hypothetical protein N7474_006946 [Penicillium riverlandense]